MRLIVLGEQKQILNNKVTFCRCFNLLTISKYFETTLSQSAVSCARNQCNDDDSGCFLEFLKQRHMHWEMKWFIEIMTWVFILYIPSFGNFRDIWRFVFFLKIMENHYLHLPKKEANHDAVRGILVENVNSRIYIQI